MYYVFVYLCIIYGNNAFKVWSIWIFIDHNNVRFIFALHT